MSWEVFWTMAEIQVIAVALIDCSGFTEWAKAKIARWLGVRVEISLKPFDCSLCVTHWSCLIWLLASGNISLTAYMAGCLLALMTTVTARGLAFVKYGFIRIIDYGEKIIS